MAQSELLWILVVGYVKSLSNSYNTYCTIIHAPQISPASFFQLTGILFLWHGCTFLGDVGLSSDVDRLFCNLPLIVELFQVASWGAYLFQRNVLAMSFAPRDSHEAQVQFALERGVPAVIGVLGTIKLPYPSRAFDMAHCSRCLIPWGSNGKVQ